MSHLSRAKHLLLAGLGASGLWGVGTRAIAEEVGFFPGTTYKIVQLTGDGDTTRRTDTITRTNSNAHVSETDLGSPFEHKGQLYFLFGDTPSLERTPGDRLASDYRPDFLAWNSDTSNRPENVFLTAWRDVQRPGSHAQTLTIPGVSLKEFEVPSGGISVNGSIYLVATTDHYKAQSGLDASAVPIIADYMGRSVMAVSHDDGQSFARLYDVSTQNVVYDGPNQAGHPTNLSANFINVSMVEVNGQDFPNILPSEPCVLIWGTGMYRESNVRLAYVPSAHIGDNNRSAFRYFAGLNHVPMWSVNEADAGDLFDERNPSTNKPVTSELSVVYCPQLAKWIMLYYDPSPPQVHMRSAATPWGPWSAQPVVVFDGWKDRAYANYLHVNTAWQGKQWDVFSAPGRQNDWGGPYGPYLIPRFFQGDQNRVTIVYAMSTWNPYQVVLMQSDIGYPSRFPRDDVARIATLPGSAGDFLVSFNRIIDGKDVPHVTSFGANGEADMGVWQYNFVVGSADQALEFWVHGGDAVVVLIENPHDIPPTITDVPTFYTNLKRGDFGRVVEVVIGPQNNDVDVAVRWGLRRHRGKSMRLMLIDSVAGAWGFISVSEIRRILGPTVVGAYAAATAGTSVPNLIINAGTYSERPTMSLPATLTAEDGAVTIGP